MLKVLLTIQTPDHAISELLKNHLVDTLPAGISPADLLMKKSYDLILLENHISMLPNLKVIDPRTEIILMGDQEEDALEAIKMGAAAYITPQLGIEGLQEVINKIQESLEMRRETAELEQQLSAKYIFAGIVGRNPQMLDITSLIRRIAPHYRSVLIFGETGTGKEVIARALHASSPQAKHPFAVFNCGGVVENLLESELFGHEKGSFTGAIRDKIGLFEGAGEGSLFLDEIGELPLSFQPHLLRVLQNGEFRRVGSHTTSKAQCRIIAATNRNLEAAVAQGRFREDLFFRITPLVIKVPPLRDRKDDIPLLCRHILNHFNQRTGKKVYGISRPAQAALLAHSWPGNVRELENVLEQAAIFTTESFIRPQDLPSHFTSFSQDHPLPMTLEDMEKRHIEMVLQQNRGNRSKSAKILGISRRSLLRRLDKHGMHSSEPPGKR